jgi:hypothetical protein
LCCPVLPDGDASLDAGADPPAASLKRPVATGWRCWPRKMRISNWPAPQAASSRSDGTVKAKVRRPAVMRCTDFSCTIRGAWPPMRSTSTKMDDDVGGCASVTE